MPMMTFSILTESLYPQYTPQHPWRTAFTTLGGGIGGGFLGYQAAKAFGAEHPEIGVPLGVMNGFNAGSLASEYIDRKTRSDEGSPYKGPRSFRDSVDDYLIKTGLGNAAGIALSSYTHSPVGIFAGGRIAGALGVLGKDKLMHSGDSKKTKK